MPKVSKSNMTLGITLAKPPPAGQALSRLLSKAILKSASKRKLMLRFPAISERTRQFIKDIKGDSMRAEIGRDAVRSCVLNYILTLSDDWEEASTSAIRSTVFSTRVLTNIMADSGKCSPELLTTCFFLMSFGILLDYGYARLCEWTKEYFGPLLDEAVNEAFSKFYGSGARLSVPQLLESSVIRDKRHIQISKTLDLLQRQNAPLHKNLDETKTHESLVLDQFLIQLPNVNVRELATAIGDALTTIPTLPTNDKRTLPLDKSLHSPVDASTNSLSFERRAPVAQDRSISYLPSDTVGSHLRQPFSSIQNTRFTATHRSPKKNLEVITHSAIDEDSDESDDDMYDQVWR